MKGFTPARLAQLAEFADKRPVEALGLETIPDKARLVGNPLLVHILMCARQDAHDFAPPHIHADIRSDRIHDIDRFGLGQFPGPRLEFIGLGGERAHWTKIDDIALQFRGHRLFEICGDLHILAAADGAELLHTRDFGGKAHASGALDAAVHRGLDERTQILVFDRALVLGKAVLVDAIGHRLVL